MVASCWFIGSSMMLGSIDGLLKLGEELIIQ